MNWKVTLAVLTCSTTLMSMSYTMIIPFLPMYLILELGVEPENVNWWSGLVFSVSFLISGLMAPIWGAVADKKSQKLMAIRASICLAITYFLGAIVTTPWELFWARVFQGLSAGLWPAQLAIMSSHAPREKLGLSMGVMQGALTAGGVLGPLIGGILAEVFGMRATFVIAGTSLTAISMVMIFVIKDVPKKKKAADAPPDAPRTNVLRMPVIQRMLFAACVVQMTVVMCQPVLPMYVAELQGSMDKIVLISGIVFSVVGISGVIASPPWGVLGQRWGFRPVLYLSLLLSGIFGIIQAIPHDLVQFSIWRFIGGLAFAGIFPSINAVLTRSTDPGDRGKVFGYSYAAQQFGSVIGPILGGALATFWNNQVAIAAAGFALLPVVAILYYFRPKNDPATPGHPNGPD